MGFNEEREGLGNTQSYKEVRHEPENTYSGQNFQIIVGGVGEADGPIVGKVVADGAETGEVRQISGGTGAD